MTSRVEPWLLMFCVVVAGIGGGVYIVVVVFVLGISVVFV